jgi:AcrR family transcriptional regulator
LPREHVSEIQRLRILGAMGEVAAERGGGAVTVAHIVARAGVSRRTFYDLFEDRQACFLAAFEEALSQAARTVIPAYRGSGSWRERTRAALWALLVFFDGLLGELMGMVVLPYLGPAGARREVERPTPPPLPTQIEGVSDPLGGLDMRITYRTVRVLITIAANPGASNRQVAAMAGISDQGQVSKLLARLLHLGLARNEGDGAIRGTPNAWFLTDRGQRIERAVHAPVAPR